MSSSSSGRGKLSLKGEKVQNLSFQRQTPKFLQQYQHLLSNNRKNYSNEVLVDDGREMVRPGEKLTVEAIKASGAVIANIEDEDEDIQKIKALYERDASESLLSRPNTKPISASDAFGIKEPKEKREEEEASNNQKPFDPKTQKITFKRKSKDISGSSGSSSSSSTSDKPGNGDAARDVIANGDSNSNDSGASKSGTQDQFQKKKEKRKPIISFDFNDD